METAMEIRIEFCLVWNYKPRAAGLAAAIKARRGSEASVVPGARGSFEVIVDGRKIFSKLDLGRFPTEDEILAAL